MSERTEREQGRKRRRKVGLAIAVGATAIEATIVAKRRGSLFGMDTVVRCLDGHLFTTRWIPGASLKAIRLGWWRLQRCPVGHHWSLVTPVHAASLSEEERELAAQHHDTPIP